MRVCADAHGLLGACSEDAAGIGIATDSAQQKKRSLLGHARRSDLNSPAMQRPHHRGQPYRGVWVHPISTSSVAKAVALKAASADPTTTPLQFLLGVMRDPNAPPALRVQVARAAAPLVHAKPGNNPLGDRVDKAGAVRETDGFAIDIEEAKAHRDIEHRLAVFLRKQYGPSENGGPLTAAEIEEESELDAMFRKRAAALVYPPGYGPGDAMKDSNRLHQLHCKRLSPPSCGETGNASWNHIFRTEMAPSKLSWTN